jgi:type IV pilus assembly protein PilQ
MMTATNQTGEARGILPALRTAAIALCLMAAGGAASAANVLQDIRYAAAPGGKVDITLQFSGPVGAVQAFTTDSPPRIALDLPNTSNGLSARKVTVGSGATSSVSAAEAGGRTRVVVDLLRPAGYTTRSAGNLLVLTVDAGAAATANSVMVNSADPIKRVPSNINLANIDFRRGDGGAGRLILRFDHDGASADMRTEGDKIIIDVSNAQLPENLRRRLDVTDFATPVASIEPRANAGSTRLVINTSGAYESSAYQTGNEYVLEVSPKHSAAVIQAAGAVTEVGGAQRYTGKPVTFNFQDVPVRTVLQLMAEESGLNLVVADTVGGSVTLRLINVPWDQAMDIVLRAKGLDKRRDGNVVWVAPQAELASYEQAVNQARVNLDNSAELATEYIPISYANATALAGLLGGSGAGGAAGGSSGGGGGGQTRGFMSPRGSVTADDRTNTLLLVDIPKRIDAIKKLLETLDRPVDQVLIEARVVIADDSFSRDLGAKFGFSNTNTSHSGDTTTSNGFDLSLPVSGGGAFNFSILKPTSNLELELSALEQEGRGEVISNPRVITSNQREATITQGDEIGYVTPSTTSGGSTGGGQAISAPAFKDATLELKVTPTITQDGRVFLSINLKKDDVKSFFQGVPSLTKRAITTAVLVDSGATVVIGGVYEFRERQDISGLPWLRDLPVLGNLFKKNGKSHSKAELLMFITPRILQVPKR